MGLMIAQRTARAGIRPERKDDLAQASRGWASAGSGRLHLTWACSRRAARRTGLCYALRSVRRSHALARRRKTGRVRFARARRG